MIAGWTTARDGAHITLAADAPAPATLDELRRFVVGLARNLGRGRIDPDDLAQDVFERWLRAAPALPIANPRAWMAVVVRRLLFDRLRRLRVSSAATAAVAVAVVEPEPGDARPWWHELDGDAIRRELAFLSPALRETFELFTFEALSYHEIARRLDITESTVGVRISRARAALRSRLSARAPS